MGSVPKVSETTEIAENAKPTLGSAHLAFLVVPECTSTTNRNIQPRIKRNGGCPYFRPFCIHQTLLPQGRIFPQVFPLIVKLRRVRSLHIFHPFSCSRTPMAGKNASLPLRGCFALLGPFHFAFNCCLQAGASPRPLEGGGLEDSSSNYKNIHLTKNLWLKRAKHKPKW